MENKGTILIIDDEVDLVEVLVQTLTQEGYNVISTTEGVKALEILKNNTVDLLILDLFMPKINGHTVCKLVKSDSRYCHIPIIIVTASTDEDDREWAFKIGADAYISKPFDFQNLLAVIEQLLHKKNAT